ncbi:MAG: hypothetical protein HYT06_02070 [Candidatus Levybacteria bacterium]|nr:hypothetical protein [Candidatus Levybacteria bacterium]
MALQDELERKYKPPQVTPERFGNHFRPAPKRDALGRRDATALEVQRAMQGEFSPDPAPSPKASAYLLRRERKFATRRGRGR